MLTKYSIGLFLGLFLCSDVLFGQEGQFNNAVGKMQIKLDAALKDLGQLQESIGQEKVPLAKELRSVEDALQSKTKEYQKIQRDNENSLVELNSLKSRVKSHEEVLDYLGTLLTEYSRRLETRLHIAEGINVQDDINAAIRSRENDTLNRSEKLNLQFTALELGIARMEERLGGRVMEGEASVGDKIIKGKFAFVGPIGLFSDETGNNAGLAELKLGSPVATLLPADSSVKAEIKSLTYSGAGEFPFDPTLGNAEKIQSAGDSTTEVIKKGGPVGYVIIALGVFSLVVGIFKLVSISKVKSCPANVLQGVLNDVNQGEMDEALAKAKTVTGPVSDLLMTAVRFSHVQKEYLEELLFEKVVNARPKMEKGLTVITITAATAPLLGLLGTVTGMINTFNMIAVFGTGDPRTLSGGISEALVTTMFGLVVAIPALILGAFLNRKVRGFIGGMEQTAVGFVNGIIVESEKKS